MSGAASEPEVVDLEAKRKAPKRIDLDAARAARREATGGAPVVVLEGEEIELPAELPATVLESIGELFAVAREDGDDLTPEAALAVVKIIESLLGPDLWATLGPKLSLEDLFVLLGGDKELGIDGLLDGYGIDLPNS